MIGFPYWLSLQDKGINLDLVLFPVYSQTSLSIDMFSSCMLLVLIWNKIVFVVGVSDSGSHFSAFFVELG